jgi:hypothetical protein
MNEIENKKISKREYWQGQIKAWQESELSQSAYCAQSGINLSTFLYWRSIVLGSENNTNKFSTFKIIKDEAVNKSLQSVQIKLLSGHVVHLPIDMGLNEIANLIHLLGLHHA